MTNNFPIEFVGAIIGGSISGGVGILVAWYMNSQKEKNWLKEYAYVPLYDSITKIQLEPKFYDYTENQWNELESHKKFKVDKTIKELYTKYVELRKQHDRLLVEWHNEYQKKYLNFVLLIAPVFKKFGLQNDGKIFIKPDYSVSIETFVHWFKDVLFDYTIKDSGEFYEHMLSFAKIKNDVFYEIFKSIHDTKPDFYNELFKKLKELKLEFPKNIDYDKLVEKRNELKPLIIKIKAELQNRIK